MQQRHKVKISDAQSKKQQTQDDLKEAQSRISSLEAKKDDLQAYLTELDSQLSDLADNLSDLQEKSDAKQSELEELKNRIRGSERPSEWTVWKHEIKNSVYVRKIKWFLHFYVAGIQKSYRVFKYSREYHADYQVWQRNVSSI